MRSWLSLLGGLVIWAVHFLGSYLIASALPGTTTARWLVLVLTGLCLSAALVLLARARERLRCTTDELRGWMLVLTGSGYSLVIVAMVFQALPAVID